MNNREPIRLVHCTAKGEEFECAMQCYLAARHEIWVYALGAVGPERGISFLSTALKCGRTTESISFYKCPEMTKSGAGPWSQLWPAKGGFECYKHHLGYDQWQLLAISKERRFMFHDTDDALWNLLHSDLFTTPILRKWVPGVRAKLQEETLLRKMPGFGCESAFLLASTEGLDRAVSTGIQGGDLTFTDKLAAKSA